MLLKIIDQEIGHRRNAALCFGRVGFIQRRLATQRDAVLTGAGYLQRKTHACYAATNNQKIKFMYHLFMYYWVILLCFAQCKDAYLCSADDAHGLQTRPHRLAGSNQVIHD